jgi:hypothetical protein
MNICTICDKQFSTPYNLERHKSRKNPCKKIIYDFNCLWCDKAYTNKSNLNRHLKQKHPPISTNFHQNSTKIPPFYTKNPPKNMVSSLSCKYCDKEFTRPDSLKRHINHRCKEKKEMNSITINGNNTTINNNNNNTTNNINLVSFGDEDLSKISDKVYKYLLSKGYMSVPEFIKYIHFNKNKPENQNILLSDLTRNYLNVFNKHNWEIINKKETMNKLFDEKHDKLVEYYNNDCPIDEKHKFNSFKNFTKDLNDDDKKDELKRSLLNELYIYMYNKKHLIMKS